MWVYVNGQIVPEEEAKISVFDHGLLYGDGVFEGIRVYNGRVFKLDEHLERLYHSAHCLMIPIPMSREQLKEEILSLLKRNQLYDQAYIRLVVTRGIGDLGINPKKCRSFTDPARVSLIIITAGIQIYPPEDYEKGIRCIICSTRKVNPNALPAQVKSLNYLNNILAIIEANQAGAKEGIMLTDAGYVSEATVDNIFVVREKKIYTPPPHLGLLIGITRNTVMDIARAKGYEVYEEEFTPYFLYTADEVFLTGTGAEVIPVVEIDGRKIGDGKPGKITMEIIQAFRELVQKEGTPIPR
ncbi:MAG: branched-chain-amino-acid transaminase [bacterium]